MKTRFDFVSNSSSCSFIIRSKNDVALSDIVNDNKLLAAMDAVKDVEICAGQWTYNDSYENGSSKVFSDDIVSQCKESDIFEKVSKKKMTLKKSLKSAVGIELLANVLQQADEIMLDFGLDDCGEFTGIASQVGMLFEMAGFEVDDSVGETPYPSVQKWLLKKI